MRRFKNKDSRSLNFSLRGDNKEFIREKKSALPDRQYGRTHRRSFSTYANQNREKKKALIYFGLKEKQLKNIFIKSKKKQGNASLNMIIHLISRLDNLASFLVSTRRMSRQWATHGLFLINRKKINIPSFLLKPGDKITLKEKLFDHQKIKEKLSQLNNIKIPKYISLDEKERSINYLRYPNEKEIIKGIDMSAVVEWYNKKSR